MARGWKWTPVDNDRLIRLYKQGLTDREIAQRLGRSSSDSIRKQRYRLGLVRKEDSPTNQAAEQIEFERVNENEEISQLREEIEDIKTELKRTNENVRIVMNYFLMLTNIMNKSRVFIEKTWYLFGDDDEDKEATDGHHNSQPGH